MCLNKINKTFYICIFIYTAHDSQDGSVSDKLKTDEAEEDIEGKEEGKYERLFNV